MEWLIVQWPIQIFTRDYWTESKPFIWFGLVCFCQKKKGCDIKSASTVHCWDKCGVKSGYTRTIVFSDTFCQLNVKVVSQIHNKGNRGISFSVLLMSLLLSSGKGFNFLDDNLSALYPNCYALCSVLIWVFLCFLYTVQCTGLLATSCLSTS